MFGICLGIKMYLLHWFCSLKDQGFILNINIKTTFNWFYWWRRFQVVYYPMCLCWPTIQFRTGIITYFMIYQIFCIGWLHVVSIHILTRDNPIECLQYSVGAQWWTYKIQVATANLVYSSQPRSSLNLQYLMHSIQSYCNCWKESTSAQVGPDTYFTKLLELYDPYSLPPLKVIQKTANPPSLLQISFYLWFL